MLILIVDDSRTARRLLVEILGTRPEFASCKVEEATSGADALTRIALLKPDVVIADINMPGMDGLALLKEVRSRLGLIRFGFLTADRSMSMRDEALSKGADFFLNKGCSVELLSNALFGVERESA